LRVFLKPDIPRWEEDLLMRQIEFEKNKFRSDAERVNYATNRRIGIRHDANQRRFATKSWAPDEWLTFVDAFVRQSSAWNRKFWLIPPPYFSLFDFKHRQSTIRPNIACEFELAIVGENGNPHNKVEAINLYVFDAFFRPNATRLSSQAIDIRTMSSVDAAGIERDHKNYSTIAHEVGHMLGLRHIGMTRDLANCALAMVLDRELEQDLIPAIWKGGANAGVCYGDRGSAGDADNVMGMGGEFAVENARPWQNRMVEHMRVADFNMWDWTVSMKETPPKVVNGK
jgi:hypothetical protein